MSNSRPAVERVLAKLIFKMVQEGKLEVGGGVKDEKICREENARSSSVGTNK